MPAERKAANFERRSASATRTMYARTSMVVRWARCVFGASTCKVLYVTYEVQANQSSEASQRSARAHHRRPTERQLSNLNPVIHARAHSPTNTFTLTREPATAGRLDCRRRAVPHPPARALPPTHRRPPVSLHEGGGLACARLPPPRRPPPADHPTCAALQLNEEGSVDQTHTQRSHAVACVTRHTHITGESTSPTPAMRFHEYACTRVSA